MNKKNKKPFVPKLRFPEFQDSGEWKEKTIRELFNLAKKSEKAIVFDKEKIITVKLHTNGVIKNEKTNTLTGGANYFRRSAGDFIFSKIDLLNGAFGLVPDELDGFFSSSDVPAYSFKNKESSFFFLNWLKSSYKNLRIERTGTSNTLKRVSPESFLKISILLPTLPEQQRIADCLTSFDELITAEDKKLEAYKAHKNGLIQKLFPAEGETVPEWRFPEFQDSGLINFKNGNEVFGPISNKNQNFDLPILAITQEHGAIPRDLIDYRVSVSDKSIESYKVVEIGDFIISLRSFQGGIEYSSYQGLCSPAYIILRKKTTVFDFYYKHYFKTGKFIQELNKNIEGIRDGKMVSYNQFSSLLLPVPDIKEQQKIADCLSSLDELITAQSQKIDVLKAHKKGLMQGLFPSADEVSV